MLTDSMADSRVTAAMLPTGPTANQARDRANVAGTEGPPVNAPTRAEPSDRARDSDARPIIFERDASEIARSVVENRMLPLPDADASPQPDSADKQAEAAAEKAEQRQRDMAEAAFAETQKINRQMQEDRAATMRIAM